MELDRILRNWRETFRVKCWISRGWSFGDCIAIDLNKGLNYIYISIL